MLGEPTSALAPRATTAYPPPLPALPERPGLMHACTKKCVVIDTSSSAPRDTTTELHLLPALSELTVRTHVNPVKPAKIHAAAVCAELQQTHALCVPEHPGLACTEEENSRLDRCTLNHAFLGLDRNIFTIMPLGVLHLPFLCFYKLCIAFEEVENDLDLASANCLSKSCIITRNNI